MHQLFCRFLVFGEKRRRSDNNAGWLLIRILIWLHSEFACVRMEKNLEQIFALVAYWKSKCTQKRRLFFAINNNLMRRSIKLLCARTQADNTKRGLFDSSRLTLDQHNNAQHLDCDGGREGKREMALYQHIFVMSLKQKSHQTDAVLSLAMMMMMMERAQHTKINNITRTISKAIQSAKTLACRMCFLLFAVGIVGVWSALARLSGIFQSANKITSEDVDRGNLWCNFICFKTNWHALASLQFFAKITNWHAVFAVCSNKLNESKYFIQCFFRWRRKRRRRRKHKVYLPRVHAVKIERVIFLLISFIRKCAWYCSLNVCDTIGGSGVYWFGMLLIFRFYTIDIHLRWHWHHKRKRDNLLFYRLQAIRTQNDNCTIVYATHFSTCHCFRSIFSFQF